MDNNFKIKAHLLYEGIDITPKAKQKLDSISDIWLMDDYITCSGVTLKFENQYVTTKVNEKSSYILDVYDSELIIYEKGSENNGEQHFAIVIPPPQYMKDEIFIEGKSICCYVNTYLDRVRIQLMEGCASSCKFCNARDYSYNFNNLEALDRALNIALSESYIRHALLSSGNAKTGKDLEKLTSMYEFFINKYSNLEIDLMTPPRGFSSYFSTNEYKEYINFLYEIGLHGLSVNVELNDKKYLKYFCPEKYEIGQDNYFKFIEDAVIIFGKNNVRSLLIVGLEPLSETLKGVERLASIGCNPVLSPLFPYGEAQGNLSAELFIEAREESEKICKKYNIELGPLCEPCSHNTL